MITPPFSTLEIFNTTALNFEEKALQLFRWQYENVAIYRKYCSLLHCQPEQVEHLLEIPFLPIEVFKHHVVAVEGSYQAVFRSSRTTGGLPAQHFVINTMLYEQSFMKSFELFYGAVANYCVLGLLPGYLEREDASLVFMVDKMIKQALPRSGFYLNQFVELYHLLNELKANRIKVILFGVTHALLEFVTHFPINFPELIVVETGGMKGKGKELIREELHLILKEGFGVNVIHSEYGMTELLSQAYSKGEGLFHTPHWMKVLARDTVDPFSVSNQGKHTAINVVDLANTFSCAFIATADVGNVFEDGSFEVLGRLDNAEMRGCNLMVL